MYSTGLSFLLNMFEVVAFVLDKISYPGTKPANSKKNKKKDLAILFISELNVA